MTKAKSNAAILEQLGNDELSIVFHKILEKTAKSFCDFEKSGSRMYKFDDDSILEICDNGEINYYGQCISDRSSK